MVGASRVDFVEWVAAEITVSTATYRDLRIELESPSGMISVLSVPTAVHSHEPPNTLAFRYGTARHLGESPEGVWKLRIRDEFAQVQQPPPSALLSWQLTFYGHQKGSGSTGVPRDWPLPRNPLATPPAPEPPELPPPPETGASSECRKVAPYWHGTGGIVVRPSDGVSATVEIKCGRWRSRFREYASQDGLVVRLISAPICQDDVGQPIEGQLSVDGISPGGWYWISGDRNAAVAPLVCEGSASGAVAAVPGGVTAVTQEGGTWVLHHTSRLTGIIPHLVAGRPDVLHSPYWRGNGGVVGEAVNGESFWVKVQCGQTWTTKRVEVDPDTHIGAALLQETFCWDLEGQPIAGSLEVRGMKPGGWYWVAGTDNAAASALFGLDELQGPKPLTPAGTVLDEGPHGTLFQANDSRLIAIVPRLTVEE